MRVRVATCDDAAGVLAIYAPFVRDTAVSFEATVPTEREMASRIAAAPLWLVAADDEAVAGYAYASPHRARDAYRWSVETSVYVAARAQRRGLARALYGALLDVLRLQGYANAYAGISQPTGPAGPINAASTGLHKALGFRQAGLFRQAGFKSGAWHDVGWWALRLGDGSAPDPPCRLGCLADAVRARLDQASHALAFAGTV